MFRSKSKFIVTVAMCFLVVGGTLSIQQVLAGIISVNQTVPLSQLIGGNDIIVVGDKTFDDFFYNPQGGAPAASDVSVMGINSAGVYGLVFTSGGFAAGGFNADSVDAGLGFRVTATDPGKLISGAQLFGTAITDGSGDARIGEAFSNVSGPTMLIRSFRVDDNLVTSKTSDSVTFAQGVKELMVRKDISIEVPGPNNPLYDIKNLAEITTFTQLFPQVPEPTTLSMAGLALLCGGYCSRKRRKS